MSLQSGSIRRWKETCGLSIAFEESNRSCLSPLTRSSAFFSVTPGNRISVRGVVGVFEACHSENAPLVWKVEFDSPGDAEQLAIAVECLERLTEAVKYIEQGHIRVGPDTVTDPAFLATRAFEDFVTWVDTSKIKRKVLQYNERLDDYDLLN